MVGRAAELERLRRLQPGRDPEVAMVAGEGGVGKTRLVGELVGGLPAGTSVLSGRAMEGGMGRPFGLLQQAVEPLVAGWDDLPAALQPRADPIRVLLEPVAPLLAGRVDRDYGPEELLRAGVELVRQLVGDEPSVLVFEDLHWADAESVALFGRLATTPDLGLLLVGTYRPEDLSRRDPLTSLLLTLDRQRTILQLNLDRLDRNGVRDLLAAVFERNVPWDVVDALYERTGGNPFYLEELLVTADGDVESLATSPLPWSLSEAVLRHLDGLPPEALRIVDAAAVLGQRISFDLLAAITGAGEDELIAGLRTLVEGNLLVEEEPDVFSFRHALTREAVESQLLGRERRRLHEKALAALLEGGTHDYSALAHHAVAAARFDEALDFARIGAQRYLRSGSTWQALRLAELALTEAPDDIDLLRLARLAAWMVGLYDVAEVHGQRALDVAVREQRPEVEAELLGHLARLKWDSGDLEGHGRTVDRALELAEQLPASEELAVTQTLLAEAYMLMGESADAVLWADRALDLAAALDRPELRPRAMVAKGSALLEVPARADEGLAILADAGLQAEANGDNVTLARALHNSLHQRARGLPVGDVWQLVERIREVAERAGFDIMAGVSASLLAATVAAAEGDRAGLEAHLAEGRRRDRSPGDATAELWFSRWYVILAIEAGDAAAAHQMLLAMPPAPGAKMQEVLDHRQLSLEVAALQGDVEGVRSHLAVMTRLQSGCDLWGEPVVPSVHAALRAGLSPDEVGEAADALFAVAARGFDDAQRHAHVDAMLLEARGDHAGALDRYREAIPPGPGLEAAWKLADAHQGAARSLLALRRNEEARVHATEAVVLLARWPGWRQREATALLRRLGGSTADVDGARAVPQSGGPEVLTPREREVAALLAEGLSNGEVARRLYISTKTAAVHVSNILAKLGMASRAEVAAWAVRTGLAAD
jgi:DNA-binding NarL/FixJ family response regulator